MRLSWWQAKPDANIGIVTGHESGLIVIDVDVRHDGDKMLEARELRDGPLPPTATATTGSGFHYFFRHAGGHVKAAQTHSATASTRGAVAEASGGSCS